VPPGYDDRVTDPAAPSHVDSDDGPTPAPSTAPTAAAPGEQRRLARPPSDRFKEAEPSADQTTARDPGTSVARGIVLAIVAGIVGAVAIVVLGGVAAVSAGLVVVAAATGWAVGAALAFGARDLIAARRRIVLAVVISLAAVVLAQVGLWQYALREGGVLPLVDYLAEVFGPLVPLQALAAVIVAWIAAR
jgi:hypothetical protein